MGKAKVGEKKQGKSAKRGNPDSGIADSTADASVSNPSGKLSSQEPPPRKKRKLTAKKTRTSSAGKCPRAQAKKKTLAKPPLQEGVVQCSEKFASSRKPAYEERRSTVEKYDRSTEKVSKAVHNTGSKATGPSDQPSKGPGKFQPLLTVVKRMLSLSAILGTDRIKDNAWKTFLQQAVDIVRDADELDAAAKKKAIKTVRSLETKETATKAGRVALTNFEYFDEDRIGTFICIGFEDSIPVDWRCGWSSQRVKKIASLLTLFTARLSKTDSNILKGFPIFVVAGVLNAIFTSENGDSIAAWGEDRFRTTIWETVDALLRACYKEDERSNVDLSPIKDSIDLMVLLCRKVAPLFKNRYISYAKDVQMEVRDTLNGRQEDVDVIWNCDELDQVMAALPTVSPILFDELLPQIWVNNTYRKSQEFPLTTLVFEALYLLKDIFYPIRIWQHKDWNPQFQDLMYEMDGEEDRGYYNLDFNKVFSLIQVLHGSGMPVDRLDTHVLAHQLVGRINVNGMFTERRVREDIPDRYRRRLAVDRKPNKRRVPNKVGRFAAV